MHVWVIIHDQDTFENAHTAPTITNFVAVSEAMLRKQRNIGVLALTSATKTSNIRVKLAVREWCARDWSEHLALQGRRKTRRRRDGYRVQSAGHAPTAIRGSQVPPARALPR